MRTALKESTKHLQVIEHSVRAFSKQNSKVLISSENIEIEAKERLSGVLESLSDTSLEFTLNDCLPGYLMYLNFIKKKLASMQDDLAKAISLEDLYIFFHRDHSDISSIKPFVKLFEYYQIVLFRSNV